MIVRRQNRCRPRPLLILSFFLAAALPACLSGGGEAGESSGLIAVSDVWSRPAVLLGDDRHDHDAGDDEGEAEGADSATVGVVYLTVENLGDEDDRLLSGSSAVAAAVEFHATSVDGGVMQMRQIEDGVDLAAGETVRFEPGGLHIMLVGLTQSLEPGDAFDVRLTFEHAGEMTVRSEVRDGP